MSRSHRIIVGGVSLSLVGGCVFGRFQVEYVGYAWGLSIGSVVWAARICADAFSLEVSLLISPSSRSYHIFHLVLSRDILACQSRPPLCSGSSEWKLSPSAPLIIEAAAVPAIPARQAPIPLVMKTLQKSLDTDVLVLRPASGRIGSNQRRHPL